MQVQFSGIVRDIKDWVNDQQGQPLPASKVTSQILFMDGDSGGDVSLTFPAGHGFVVGKEYVNVDVIVKGTIKNYKQSLYVIAVPRKVK